MGSTLIIFIIGIATFFNFAIILHKFKSNNLINGSIDLTVLIITLFLFSSSTTALAIGMIASMLFSLYLIAIPIHFDFLNNNRYRKYKKYRK